MYEKTKGVQKYLFLTAMRANGKTNLVELKITSCNGGSDSRGSREGERNCLLHPLSPYYDDAKKWMTVLLVRVAFVPLDPTLVHVQFVVTIFEHFLR